MTPELTEVVLEGTETGLSHGRGPQKPRNLHGIRSRLIESFLVLSTSLVLSEDKG